MPSNPFNNRAPVESRTNSTQYSNPRPPPVPPKSSTVEGRDLKNGSSNSVEPPKSPNSPPEFSRKAMRFFSETWVSEVSALILSVASLVGVIVVLWKYDGRENPEWAGVITLNTVLSFGITIMSAALAVPISGGLGQLKWMKSKKEVVPLLEMDILDQASRGMWGSIMVLCNWTGGFLGALGALTFILTLSVPPLAQQAILITSERISSPSDTAFITTTQGSRALSSNGYKDKNGGLHKIRSDQLPTLMRGAYFNAIYGNFDKTSVSENYAGCSTGNCTWEPFPTLGICSSCNNVTKFLEFNDGGGDYEKANVTLPGGPVWNGRLYYSIAETIPSNRINHTNTTVMRFAALDGQTAMECTLDFCVQVIEASIEKGLLREKVIQTYTDSVPVDRFGNDRVVDTFYPPDSVNSSFKTPIFVGGLDFLWVSEAMTFLGDVGNLNKSTAEADVIAQGGMGNLTKTVTNIGDAMGRALRIVASESKRTPGSAWKNVNIVRIQWYWLAAPLAVELLGLTFFCGMVLINHRSGTQLWKTSLLAAYFHGPQLDELKGESEIRRLEGLYAMDAEAEKMKVVLENRPYRCGYGSRLVQQ